MHTHGDRPMTTEMTPEEARGHLAHAEAATGRRAGDRRIHALSTGGMGVAIGAFVALRDAVDGTAWQTPLQVAYAFALVGLALWQTRASRVVPRGARRTGYTGLSGTLVLALAAIMTLNYRSVHPVGAVEPWWVLAGAGVLVALPMVLAGLLIRRGPR